MSLAQIIAAESICASGLNSEIIFKNAIDGRCSQSNGLNAISTEIWLDLKDRTPLELQKSKSTILSYQPLKDVLEKTEWTNEELRDCGFIFATTTSEIDIWENQIPFFNNEKIQSPRKNIVSHQSLGIIIEDLRSFFNIQGPCSVLSSSCSASLQALALASAWIKMGKVKRCIVGSTEILSTLTTSGFESLRLISRQNCKPFDKNRSGINLGEASAFIALEKESRESKKALAFMSGFGLSSDAYHSTSPQPEGSGSEQAIKKALQQSQIEASEISWFYAHGTGSLANDLSEARAIERLFPKGVFVSSTKSIHGHTLACSGLLESVLSIQSLKNQMAIPNSTYETADPAFKLNLTQRPEKNELNHILKNSLGFGGINCSLIISRNSRHADI